jgi:predicted RecB family nuclease
MITASQIYDYLHCPHRVYLDAFGDPTQREEPNDFVQLLWEQGLDHERQIVGTLGDITDLSQVPTLEREAATREAMKRGASLIYQGRLTSDDRVGVPDLLERRGDGYVPGDVKAGAGMEGDEDEGRLKAHYAVQLAHYANILDREGLGTGHEGFVIDRSGARVPYPLDQPRVPTKPQTLWQIYEDAESQVRGIVQRQVVTRPAMCAQCKLCHWRSHCRGELIRDGDLTLVAELGRSKRDTLAPVIPNITALAACDVDAHTQGRRTRFPGIGPDTLRRYVDRARLLVAPNARPYLKEIVRLPAAEREVYFDIEADPMRDVVYLHGFVEREHGEPQTAVFVPLFAEDGKNHEEQAFGAAWEYLQQRARDSVIYYYSKYERTAYRKLAERYPQVCSVEQVNALFGRDIMVDLYSDVVRKATEWPTYDQSIKTLAQFLGFAWRDPHPSGAASIEWYHRWVDSRDPAVRQRILEYNEDDCLATGVLVDAIRDLAA